MPSPTDASVVEPVRPEFNAVGTADFPVDHIAPSVLASEIGEGGFVLEYNIFLAVPIIATLAQIDSPFVCFSEKAVMESLREHETELLRTPIEIGAPDIPPEYLLHTKERELESLRDGVGRLKDLFVMGDVTKAEYKARLERLKDLIVKKENEYEQLKESLDGCSPLTHAERLRLIDELKSSWTTAIDVKERNRLMKLMIERIDYTRNGGEIDLQVKFK